ncbi:MAG: ABC transporter substrate-binding protein [Oscillospiraceae bacterium]|nr:ABC transporter substrate-binding protein [Oscillospiraceae bacterium]
MKKIIALALAVIMILALVGCGSTSREIVQLTLSSEDSEKILAAAGIMLPDAEDTDAAGTTIQWFSWYDDFHNYSDEEIVNTGYWTFTNKYGCEVEWIECTWSTRFDELANLVLSSQSPDFYPGNSNTFPIRVLKGMFQAVDTYVDYDDPLWAGMKEYTYSYYSLKGRPYIICYDNATGDVVIYNRRVMEEFGYDDPAELYYNDEWTWDVFYEMCVDFSDEDEDRYALDGWFYFTGLIYSSGTTPVIYNTETHHYESNIDDPRLERAANLLYDLSKNDCVYPWWNNNWSLRNGIEGSGMKEGLLLFYIGGIDEITGTVSEISAVWGDITDGEVMFAPLPRDDDGDGKYYTESYPSGYCIVTNASNPEAVALLAACDRFKVLDPTVISVDEMQLRDTYLWTQEMLDMYETVYDLCTDPDSILVGIDGVSDKLSSVISSFTAGYHYEEVSTWAQLKESYSDMLDYYIDELNSQIDEFDPEAT